MTAVHRARCYTLRETTSQRGTSIAPIMLIATAILVALPASATEIPPADRRSDYEIMGPQTRAMQDDDTANPGMLGVLDGEALWNRRDGAAAKSCADCHNDARSSMRGVAARYPAYSPALGRPIDLEARINQCRTDQQKATPLRFESKELLGLTAYLALQSRGMPIDVADDEHTKPFVAAGREIFNRRQGQINLSCAQCHDDNWGQKLAGAPIPQGHPNGYPVYRLEWQSLGSLQRRLRNCMSGMRAEPYAFGAPENVDLELYLMWRARGLKMEAPAVRP
jgi:L-cysteine S-thiosulfotransferase